MVPPDPMPNSEVKRRSADGSVGSPHARVGNCQASNKTKGSVERLSAKKLKTAGLVHYLAVMRWTGSAVFFSLLKGLSFYLLFVGELDPYSSLDCSDPVT